MSEQVLGFDRAASKWTEALPLGNGHIGAMVFGRAHDERIALNEGTVWSGSPRNEQATAVPATLAREAVTQARAAVLKRRFAEASAAVQRLQSRYTQSFVSFGDLRLATRNARGKRGNVVGLRRELDLSTAVHTVTFRQDAGSVRRTDFVSHPDRVLVVVLDSEQPLRVEVSLDSPLREVGASGEPRRLTRLLRAPADVPPPHERGRIRWSEVPGEAVEAAAVIGWAHDGVDGAGEPHRLRAAGVRHLTLCLAIETTFTVIGEPPTGTLAEAAARAGQCVQDALAAGPTRLRERHVADHAGLFDRMSVRLGSTGEHPELDSLVFAYGRYLLIASSRPGGVPATLQGLWNERLRPKWSSNYTLNINTEMNYWAAEAVALPETAEPLFDLVEVLARRGAQTARRLYDTRGWTAHHNTDIWGYTSPVGMGRGAPEWAFWPMAGAWLALPFAEHVRHSDDAEFARDRAFPVLRGAAEFLLDWFFDVDGVPTTAPSTSPENTFRADRGRFAVGRSATMDLALAAELFDALAEVAAVAGRPDDPVVAEADAMRQRLPRIAPGRHGLIPEWADDDPPADRRHRHLSHLFGLYPGTSLRDPDQLVAARASLDARGDDSTGWSLMWKIAARARLRDREAIDRLLALAFRPARAIPWGHRGGLYPNLFAAHPPFQIDGNLGYLAGVVECLVQSHDGVIALAPAIPARWPEGEASGLIARPGVQVDLRWSQRDDTIRIDEAVLTPVTAAARTQLTVEIDGQRRLVDLRSGAPVQLTASDADQPGEGERR